MSKRPTITIEECKNSAARFDRRGDWATEESSYYQCAYRRGWVELCCSHMSPPRLGKKRTMAECKESALKFKTRSDWIKGDLRHYDYAHNKGWLDECCLHMNITAKTTEEQVTLIKNYRATQLLDKFNALSKVTH